MDACCRTAGVLLLLLGRARCASQEASTSHSIGLEVVVAVQFALLPTLACPWQQRLEVCLLLSQALLLLPVQTVLIRARARLLPLQLQARTWWIFLLAHGQRYSTESTSMQLS